MKLPKFIKKLYTKELSQHEKLWLYSIKYGVPEGVESEFPPVTFKEYKKMFDRDELYQ